MLRKYNLICIRSARLQVKMPLDSKDLANRRLWANLGTETRTNTINCTVYTGGPPEKFHWPTHFEISIAREPSEPQGPPHTFILPYTLGEVTRSQRTSTPSSAAS